MRARRSFLRRLALPLVLAGASFSAACIHRFVYTDVRSVPPSAPGSITELRSPVKVHLLDGSTVIFGVGAQIQADRIVGSGFQYAPTSGAGVPRSEIRMDSVAGVESYYERTLVASTVLVSAAATVGTAAAFAGVAKALFGSCPTVYADNGRGLELQAEGFSYAISPLMEHRDLDALRARPGADGRVRLELRNEALETHFLNHVELVAVRHAPGATVVPDQAGRPVELNGFARVTSVRDRAGRDLRPILAERDGRLFSTSPATSGAAREGDLDDWIDLDIADLPRGDSIAVILRMRNSLLNTVLLYDGMLGGRDAIDWLAQDLQHIGRTVDLSRWYVRTMGMRAMVDGVPLPEGEPFEGHARLGDIGPIAFRDVAVILPRAAVDTANARVRLRFVADNWRIDDVRVAGIVTRPSTTMLAVDSVVVPTPAVGTGPMLDTAALAMLAEADERYLETRPGQRMTLVFERDRAPHAEGLTSTYLIAWQGWYLEWIRAAWLTAPKRTTPFVPGDAAVLTALRSWTAQQEAFEHAFYSTSIPVR